MCLDRRAIHFSAVLSLLLEDSAHSHSSVMADSSESLKTPATAPKRGPTEAEVKAMITPYVLQFTKAKLFMKAYNKNDEESISGQVVIVTGANKGIGKAIAVELAKRGAIVVLACRDLVSGQKAVDEIKASTGNDTVVLMKLDVSDMASVRQFADEVKSKYPKIKILINNAGIYDRKEPLRKTPEGFNRVIATNYLGPFLLTRLLLENLKSASPSRIVTISSGTQQLGDIDLDDLHMDKVTDFGHNNMYPYSNSKLAVSLFMRELGKRMENTGVTTYAVCPGFVETDMSAPDPEQTSSWLYRFSQRIFSYTPEQSCDTVMLCCVGKSTAGETGKMYQNRQAPPTLNQKLVDNDEVGVRLWDIASKSVGLSN